MTDHYAEAERLLGMAEDSQREDLGHVLAWAQVHATLATVPPYPQTAEDLRGAQAEIDRLHHLLGSHADGHRCTCTMTKPADYHPDSMTPAEWEQDPWCPTHPDMDYILAVNERLRAIIRGDIPDAEADATVEKVARALCVADGGSPDGMALEYIDGHYTDKVSDPQWTEYVPAARAVLTALAGDDRD